MAMLFQDHEEASGPCWYETKMNSYQKKIYNKSTKMVRVSFAARTKRREREREFPANGIHKRERRTR